MKNDGKIERFRATAAKRTAEYQSLMSVVTSVYDEIQGELDAGVPMEVVTEAVSYTHLTLPTNREV